MHQTDEFDRQDIINEIIALEVEQLFDFSLQREQQIKELRDKIQFYQPVLPE